MIRRHVVVHGVVQGVGFRYSTREQAHRLGVSGWVRNRRDGAVEVEAEGSDDAVAALVDWLAHGPSGASVSSVDVTEIEPLASSGFRITTV
jgi:acylphosphatase